MIQGAESGRVPGVHEMGGQVAGGDTGHGCLDTGKHITPSCFLLLDALAISLCSEDLSVLFYL